MAHGAWLRLKLASRMTGRTSKVDVPLVLVRNTGLAEFRNNPLLMNQDSIGCACACACGNCPVPYTCTWYQRGTNVPCFFYHGIGTDGYYDMNRHGDGGTGGIRVAGSRRYLGPYGKGGVLSRQITQHLDGSGCH